jgi:hypothetical protein
MDAIMDIIIWIEERAKKGFRWFKDLFLKAETIKKREADLWLAKEKARMEKLNAEATAARNARFQRYLDSIIADNEKLGYTKEEATKRAWKKIENTIEKNKLKMVIPVKCSACGSSGCNKNTGGFVRNSDGTYKHANCKGVGF